MHGDEGHPALVVDVREVLELLVREPAAIAEEPEVHALRTDAGDEVCLQSRVRRPDRAHADDFAVSEDNVEIEFVGVFGHF